MTECDQSGIAKAQLSATLRVQNIPWAETCGPGDPVAWRTSTAEALDMTFRATRTVPGQVRGLVTSRLAAWGVAGIGDDVELIASELVTNSVQHAPGREEIRVRLTREPDAVLLKVWDSSDVRPVPRLPFSAMDDEAAPDAAALGTDHDAFTRGRGLPIVEALSESWGVTPTAPHGKWVWAKCATVGPTADVTIRRVLSRRS